MRVAVHQPNFMPWLPFFEKMAAVDKFVLLTRCQFNREAYQHRFRFNDRWHTMSIEHGDPTAMICEKRYASPQADWARIKERLRQYKPFFSQFDTFIQKRLEAVNVQIVLHLAGQLNIKTEIISDPIISSTGTDRLVEICTILGATTYLAGESGGAYMDLAKFKQAGIAVEHHVNKDKRHTFEKLCPTG